MKEIWKDIEGYEGYYQISNLGRVKSLERVVCRNTTNYRKSESILKPQTKENGYLKVNLFKNLRSRNKYVHRLVLSTFRKEGKKEEVNHIDGDKKNNKLINLEWCSRAENSRYNIILGKTIAGEKAFNSKLTEEDVIEIRRRVTQEKASSLALEYNVSFQLISRIKLRKCWKHI